MKGNATVLIILCVVIVALLVYYFGFGGLDLSVLTK